MNLFQKHALCVLGVVTVFTMPTHVVAAVTGTLTEVVPAEGWEAQPGVHDYSAKADIHNGAPTPNTFVLHVALYKYSFPSDEWIKKDEATDFKTLPAGGSFNDWLVEDVHDMNVGTWRVVATVALQMDDTAVVLDTDVNTFRIVQ